MEQDHSPVMRVFVEYDIGKGIAWQPVIIILKNTVSNVSLHFVPSLQSAVCILYQVCILYPVCSLQSAVCSLHFVLTGIYMHQRGFITSTIRLNSVIGNEQSLFPLRSRYTRGSTPASRFNARQAISRSLARLLDYSWAERETARSLIQLNDSWKGNISHKI